MINLPLSPGMMASAGAELCQVYCNGRIFEGWTEVSVVRSVQDLAGRFRLAVTEPIGKGGNVLGWQIRPGDPIRIRLGGQLAIDGYVDVRQAGYDAGSHGVEIAGRSRTADAVQAAAVTEEGKPAGPFEGYKLDEIARALLDPLSIGLNVIGDIGAAFPMVTVQVGESVFEVIERLARLRGFHLTDNAEGELVLANKVEKEGEPLGLVEGVNILAANATIDMSQSSSAIFVVGQSTGDDDISGADSANQTSSVKNESVPLPRPRPTVIVLEGPGDKEDMKTRADWEMAEEMARQTTAQVTVQGWLTGEGKLWAPRMSVKLTSPMLLVDREMLIAAVEMTQADGSGTITNLSLITPEAFSREAPTEESPVPETENGEPPEDVQGDPELQDASLSAALWNPRSTGAAA